MGARCVEPPAASSRTFGELLRAHRQAAGLSQQEMASRAGISVAAVRDLEQGRTHRPHPNSVRALTEVLGLSGEAAAALREAAYGAPAPAASAPPDGPLRIRVLGPLTVHLGATEVVLTGKRRATLGRLALSANTPVPVPELVDVLWEAGAPPGATNLVQTQVSRLRSALRPHQDRAGGGALSLVGGGYRLDLGEDQLDLAEFRRLVRDARQAAADRPADALGPLDAALRLWRGDPLGDVDELRAHPLVTALVEERIATALLHADVADALGRPGESLPWLRELAARQPLHEPLYARLIVGLAATGMQAAALSAYEEIRARLADELGIDPGAELAEAHRRVLRQELGAPAAEPVRRGAPAADRPRPAQLPADIRRFTARAAELRQLGELLDAGEHLRGVTVIVVSGTAGVGKTALAVHWAHRVADQFPDGQLYADLRGFDPGGSAGQPAEVVRGFLDALGVPPARTPRDLPDQVKLYRSLLAGRRMLVLLDNARDAAQVRPLLPGSPGCLVVATSRNQLGSLVAAEGAHPIGLDLLTAAEAREMLGSRLGPARVAAEPDAVGRIIAHTARLPLALAIVAARAATNPTLPLAALAGRLAGAGAGLDALAIEDATTDVRAVFSWSYRDLSPPAARLFRLLGLHPGPDVSAAAATSLAGLTGPAVAPWLAELTRLHLITEPAPDRYTFHDLLRAYAAELARSAEPEADRRAAEQRMVGHYLHTAYAAVLALNPQWRPFPLAAVPAGVTVEPVSTHAGAVTWFTTEHHVLISAVERAAATGFDTEAWQLARTCSSFLNRHGHWHDWAAMQETALAAANRAGDRLGQAHVHRDLGLALLRLDRSDEAEHHFRAALERYVELGDERGVALTYMDLAEFFEHHHDYPRALAEASRAADHFRAARSVTDEAQALNMLGWCHAQLGDYARALPFCEESLAIVRETDDMWSQAGVWDSLGYIHHHLGHLDRALECYRNSLHLIRARGDRYREAETLVHLGEVYDADGRPDAAEVHWRQALDLFQQLGHPRAEKIRAKLG